jgi:hypothetical protein
MHPLRDYVAGQSRSEERQEELRSCRRGPCLTSITFTHRVASRRNATSLPHRDRTRKPSGHRVDLGLLPLCQRA